MSSTTEQTPVAIPGCCARADEHHFGPLAGLVVHAIDRHRPPEGFDSWTMSDMWDCGYARSLGVRRRASTRTGRAAAWVTSHVDLVAGEPSSALASFMSRVDVANGIAVQQPPTRWTYPNMDLTVHLHRQPEGDWTGLDTSVSFGPAGHGLTSSVLHDLRGPVGHAQQILTVRPSAGR